LTLENLAGLVRELLGWMCEGYEFQFEDRFDIGSSNGPRMKMMSPVCNEKEWTTYVRVVMKSEIRGIELVARMVGRNDVGDESVLGRQRCQKRLMSRTLNMVLCLCNHRKNLMTTMMQMRSPPSLVVIE
jgi:hypothetical protein